MKCECIILTLQILYYRSIPLSPKLISIITLSQQSLVDAHKESLRKALEQYK